MSGRFAVSVFYARQRAMDAAWLCMVRDGRSGGAVKPAARPT